MRNFVIVTLINMFALFMVSGIFNGIVISSWQTLIVSAIVLSLINIYLKPVIKIIMLPVNFFTLGLFTLFINAFLLIFVESLVKGFYIKNFSTAFFGAIMLSIIYLIVEKFVIVRNDDFYKKQVSESSEKTLNKDNVIDVEGKYEDDQNDNV
ncbi:phage holin family protein [Candidatus Ruminimicrobiellum ovillum]|uniref:phage holin family protein n=1 Tax=Candidatus Ruminimicrobiellum ovillum TaxID=1947927 RepID=UPI00355A7EB6